MRGSLSVGIDDGTGVGWFAGNVQSGRLVTKHVRDLSFTKTAPGGHHSARCRLLLPRDTFRDLGPADKVYVYDSRTGRTVWSGYATNPTPTDGPSGQEWDMSATGAMSLAGDESRALVYIDRDLGVWFRDEGGGIAASATTQASVDPDGVLGDGLLCQFNPGQPVGTDHVAQIAYHSLASAGMDFGALTATIKSGKVDTGYLTELVWPTGGTALVSGSTIHQTPFVDYRVVNDGMTPAGVTRIALRLRRTGGATNIADDNTWSIFADVAVLGRRVDRYGTLASGIAGMKSTTYVRADWVVEDLLGRVLSNTCDPFASTVEATSFQIDQLAYHGGARASQILDDLALFEPDMLWEILHSTSRGHIFNYRAWPTTARYEISTKDGYEEPGPDVDLCNRVAVYWVDAAGRQQTTVVTADVPALGTRTRDADAIELPAGRGSAANAQRIGEQVLAAKADPPKAARATVGRPIMDRKTGSLVMPWEIEPGYLVRVRETGEDLRLTEMEYVDNDGAARLTLGEPELTMDQRIARLAAAS